jgi:hypothetical protein
MELDDVEIIGLHSREALLDTLADVVPGEDMLATLPGWSRRGAHQTTALAGQVEFRAPVRDVTADPLFAQPVVDRGIDIVDAGVERGVEDGFRLGFGDVAPARHPAQLHRPVAEHRDRQPGASEFPRWYRHAHPPCLNFSPDLRPTVDTS